MGNLTKEIENCKGIDNCYRQKIDGGSPIVFKMKPDSMKIMVITEQPRRERLTKEGLKEAFDWGLIPKRLVELLGPEFRENVEKETGKFYWTHFIKCPGNIRIKGVNKKSIDVCADAYLEREINYIDPSLIICIGSKCGSWFLKKYKLPYEKWLDCVYNEISQGRPIEVIMNGKKTKVLFLIHPSERSGVGWYIDRKIFEDERLNLKNLIKNI